MTRHDEVGVDLVADNNHIVLCADGAELCDFVFRPNAANRVVRIAEDKHLVFFFCAQLLKEVKINRVCLVRVDERALHVFSVIVLNGHSERIINRRHGDNAVAGIGIGQNRNSQSRYDAVCRNNFFFLNIPVVATLHPAAYRIEVFLCGAGIAEDMRIDVLFQTLYDLRRVFQLHIRNGKRCNVFRQVRMLFCHLVPFAGAGVFSGNQRFKIIDHW